MSSATGHAEPQPVQHVWINHDHDLVDVTLHTDASSSATDDTARAQRATMKAHGSQAPPAGARPRHPRGTRRTASGRPAALPCR